MVTITLSAAGAKRAASRLRKFLAADGTSLKQTNAYEALAQTLGYANWNTLQALLNATTLLEGDANSIATAPPDKLTAPREEEVIAARPNEQHPPGIDLVKAGEPANDKRTDRWAWFSNVRESFPKPESSTARAAQASKTLHCSFCGKSQHEVRKLVAGPRAFICDECAELCVKMAEG